MRKTNKTQRIILEELEKTGLVSSACGKAKIPRSTYYRWYNSDIDFRIKADESVEIGRSNMVDFAESKVIKNIQDGNQRAAEFYLRHNDDRYRNSYARDFWKQVDMIQEKYRKEYGSLTVLRDMLFEALPFEVLEGFASGKGLPGERTVPLDQKELNQQAIDRATAQIIGHKYYESIMQKLMETEGLSLSEQDRPPMPEKHEINYDDEEEEDQ